MGIDNVRYRHHNRGFVSAAPVPMPEFVFRDTVGDLPVLVVDLDNAGLEECVRVLSEAPERGLFVLWFPRRYSPADAVDFHQRLVDIGATLFERTASSESTRACWDRTKAALLTRRSNRENPLQGSGTAIQSR